MKKKTKLWLMGSFCTIAIASIIVPSVLLIHPTTKTTPTINNLNNNVKTLTTELTSNQLNSNGSVSILSNQTTLFPTLSLKTPTFITNNSIIRNANNSTIISWLKNGNTIFTNTWNGLNSSINTLANYASFNLSMNSINKINNANVYSLKIQTFNSNHELLQTITTNDLTVYTVNSNNLDINLTNEPQFVYAGQTTNLPSVGVNVNYSNYASITYSWFINTVNSVQNAIMLDDTNNSTLTLTPTILKQVDFYTSNLKNIYLFCTVEIVLKNGATITNTSQAIVLDVLDAGSVNVLNQTTTAVAYLKDNKINPLNASSLSVSVVSANSKFQILKNVTYTYTWLYNKTAIGASDSNNYTVITSALSNDASNTLSLANSNIDITTTGNYSFECEISATVDGATIQSTYTKPIIVQVLTAPTASNSSHYGTNALGYSVFQNSSNTYNLTHSVDLSNLDITNNDDVDTTYTWYMTSSSGISSNTSKTSNNYTYNSINWNDYSSWNVISHNANYLVSNNDFTLTNNGVNDYYYLVIINVKYLGVTYTFSQAYVFIVNSSPTLKINLTTPTNSDDLNMWINDVSSLVTNQQFLNATFDLTSNNITLSNLDSVYANAVVSWYMVKNNKSISLSNSDFNVNSNNSILSTSAINSSVAGSFEYYCTVSINYDGVSISATSKIVTLNIFNNPSVLFTLSNNNQSVYNDANNLLTGKVAINGTNTTGLYAYYTWYWDNGSNNTQISSWYAVPDNGIIDLTSAVIGSNFGMNAFGNTSNPLVNEYYVEIVYSLIPWSGVTNNHITTYSANLNNTKNISSSNFNYIITNSPSLTNVSFLGWSADALWLQNNYYFNPAATIIGTNQLSLYSYMQSLQKYNPDLEIKFIINANNSTNTLEPSNEWTNITEIIYDELNNINTFTIPYNYFSEVTDNGKYNWFQIIMEVVNKINNNIITENISNVQSTVSQVGVSFSRVPNKTFFGISGFNWGAIYGSFIYFHGAYATLQDIASSWTYQFSGNLAITGTIQYDWGAGGSGWVSIKTVRMGSNANTTWQMNANGSNLSSTGYFQWLINKSTIQVKSGLSNLNTYPNNLVNITMTLSGELSTTINNKTYISPVSSWEKLIFNN